jgi:hypothetical protein
MLRISLRDRAPILKQPLYLSGAQQRLRAASLSWCVRFTPIGVDGMSLLHSGHCEGSTFGRLV